MKILYMFFFLVFVGSGNHGGASFMMKRSMSFSGIENNHNNMNNKCDELMHGDEDQLSDDEGYSQLGEKKKRLSLEQVKALEKSFEIGNKLEPDRKMQLAKALGLQPRQVAIWFQNRRARWKTKQLEKEYEILKKQFESLKADNDSLKAQNHKLHAEVINYYLLLIIVLIRALNCRLHHMCDHSSSCDCNHCDCNKIFKYIQYSISIVSLILH
jgi:hypothetical protein